MANQAPSFLSAPRVRIVVNGQVLAYAVGLSFNASVSVQSINVLGSYNAVAIEPTMYQPVTGSFQIIKLVNKTVREILKSNIESNTQKDDITDNAVGTEAFNKATDTFQAGGTNMPTGNDPHISGDLKQHLDPALVLTSKTFDIEVQCLLQNAATAGDEDIKTVFVCKDCRLTGRSVNISAGQLVNEPLSFQGLLLTLGDNSNIKLDDINKETFS